MEAYTKAEVDRELKELRDGVFETLVNQRREVSLLRASTDHLESQASKQAERIDEQATLIESLRNLIPADSVKLEGQVPDAEEPEAPKEGKPEPEEPLLIGEDVDTPNGVATLLAHQRDSKGRVIYCEVWLRGMTRDQGGRRYPVEAVTRRVEPEGKEPEPPTFKPGDIVYYGIGVWLVEAILVDGEIGLWKHDGMGGRIPVRASDCTLTPHEGTIHRNISEEIQRMSEFLKEQEERRNEPPAFKAGDPIDTPDGWGKVYSVVRDCRKHIVVELYNGKRTVFNASECRHASDKITIKEGEEPAKTTGLTREEADAAMDQRKCIRRPSWEKGHFRMKMSGVVRDCFMNPQTAIACYFWRDDSNDDWEVVDD